MPRVSWRALRRLLHRQLRAIILKHLKESGVVPLDAVLTTEIQTTVWWARLLLGLLGVVMAVLGGGLITVRTAPAVILGMCLAAASVVFLIAAVRGRRQTVRAYLGRFWDSARRETEASLDEMVGKCIREGISPRENSVLEGVAMNSTGTNWVDSMPSISQLGDAVSRGGPVDIDLGGAAGTAADSILDGVVSGL